MAKIDLTLADLMREQPVTGFSADFVSRFVEPIPDKYKTEKQFTGYIRTQLRKRTNARRRKSPRRNQK
jgi:hypothetical protein